MKAATIDETIVQRVVGMVAVLELNGAEIGCRRGKVAEEQRETSSCLYTLRWLVRGLQWSQ